MKPNSSFFNKVKTLKTKENNNDTILSIIIINMLILVFNIMGTTMPFEFTLSPGIFFTTKQEIISTIENASQNNVATLIFFF